MKKELAEIEEIRKEYPVTMNKDQFYQIAHISKKTALYLLSTGIIPCRDSGKKTRKYTIYTEDVIKYLIDRDIHPSRYTASEGWYCGKPGKYKPKQSSRATLMELDGNALDRFKAYLTEEFAEADDLLTIPQVSELTGYSTTSLFRWCREKGIKHFHIRGKVLVPMIILIDFLTSEEAHKTSRKSMIHFLLIQGFFAKERGKKK